MARFSQSFLRSLTQPSFQEGLFTAARQLGGLRGQLEQERGAMQRFDQLSRATGQAQASALSGDPNALALNIRRLEEIRNAAPTLEEKRAIDSRISQLRSMAPAAKQAGLKRDITAVSQIDNVLDGLDARTDISEQQKSELKESLTLRKNQLLDNPEIEQGYRQDQVNQFRFEEAELAMREQQYIRDSQDEIQRAIQSGDKDQLDAVRDKIPPEFATITNQYITGAIRNNETVNKFNERSIALNTAPMSEAELDKIIAELPEGAADAMAPEIREYREAIKGWSDETQWSGNTNALARAQAAEKTIRSRMSGIANALWSSEITEKRRIAAEDRAVVRAAELEMAKGPTDVERLRRAKLITKEKDGEPTLQDIALADEQLTAENIDRQLSIIYNVDPERAIALGYEADDDSPEGAVSFDEAKKILSDDPSDANKQTFIDIYGTDKFNEWQKESGDTTDPGVLDVAFGVPARAVASAVTRNIVEPAFEALDLASTRKKVGKAFRQAGGDLQNVTTDELVLISRNPKGFESRINKINAEIVKRMSGE
jgi:hypothetical protein